MHTWTRIRLCITLLYIIPIMVWASPKEVTLPYEGLTLNARLDVVEGKSIKDGVILITHGGLAHNEMEIISYLQSKLSELGYNTLAINLSLGLDNRHGMYDCAQTHRHTNDDAAKEMGAWVGWLKQQGVQTITLLGHSRGGAQTALYAVEHDNPLVHSVVLLAPAIRENTDAATYQQRFGQPLAPILDQAKALVHAGQGDTLLENVGLMNCSGSKATATSFVSYYGQDPRLDTPSLLLNVKKPVLVIVAGNDEVVVGLAPKLIPLVSAHKVQMKVVEGSDHTFRDLFADDAVEAIDQFLRSGH